MTTISKQYPPKHIYDRAVEKWGVDFKKGIVFTYGDTIHSAVPIPRDLMVHELVHVRQHREYPGGADAWWTKYIEDDHFRYSQELEAYRKQYEWVKNNIKDRNEQTKLVSFYAQCLSGKMYGSVVTYAEALKAIKA